MPLEDGSFRLGLKLSSADSKQDYQVYRVYLNGKSIGYSATSLPHSYVKFKGTKTAMTVQFHKLTARHLGSLPPLRRLKDSEQTTVITELIHRFHGLK